MSGRRRVREMPVKRSTSRTRFGGTSFHEYKDGILIPSPSANAFGPPAMAIASSMIESRMAKLWHHLSFSSIGAT
jgi:hypothetical protein